MSRSQSSQSLVHVLVILALSIESVIGARISHAQPSPLSGMTLGPDSLTLRNARAEAPLELVLGGRAAVRAMLNGHGPFLLAIETGAPLVLVTERTATAARISFRPNQVDPHIRWPSGAMATALTLDSIRIGDALFRGQPVFTSPDFLPGVDGLLGLPAYAGVLMTLDYSGNRLILENGALPEPDGEEVFPIVMMNGRFGIAIQIGGERVDALIDTQGSDDISVSPAIAARLRVASPFVAAGQVKIGDHPPVMRTAARLTGALQIGRFTMTGPIVGSHEPTPGESGALIGLGMLRYFSLTIDQRNHRLRLHRLDRSLPTPPSLFGLGVNLRRAGDGSVIIANVLDGTAASDAGLKAGDVVTEIAHRAAAEFLPEGELTKLVQRGELIQFVIVRDGKRTVIDIAPRLLVR